MESSLFKIDELSGKHTQKLVKQALDTLPGVTSVSVNQGTDRVAVDFDSTGVSHQKIKEKLIQMGLGVTAEANAQRDQPVKENHRHKKGKHPLAGDNPNQNHNVKKEAQGPNTKH